MSSGSKPKNAKKTSYFVPSRYKQAAEKVSIQSSSTESSKYYGKKSNINNTHRRDDTLMNSKLSKSEEYQGVTSSTPTSKGEIHCFSLDASAVASKEDTLYVPHLKNRYLAPPTENIRHIVKEKKDYEGMLCDSVVAPIKSRKGDKFNKELAEAEIDVHYAHYLQAVFLEMEAKKVLSLRSSAALDNIHKLFNLVLLYSKKARSEQEQQLFLSCLIRINDHCQKQEQIWKPLFDILPILKQQYESLAIAINATKHKLHVKDVVIPDVDSTDNVLELVCKLKNFIENFFQEFSNINETITAAEDLKNYIEAAEHVAEALEMGLTSINNSKDLVLTEASLSVGCCMQLKL